MIKQAMGTMFVTILLSCYAKCDQFKIINEGDKCYVISSLGKKYEKLSDYSDNSNVTIDVSKTSVTYGQFMKYLRKSNGYKGTLFLKDGQVSFAYKIGGLRSAAWKKNLLARSAGSKSPWIYKNNHWVYLGFEVNTKGEAFFNNVKIDSLLFLESIKEKKIVMMLLCDAKMSLRKLPRLANEICSKNTKIQGFSLLAPVAKPLHDLGFENLHEWDEDE